MKTVLLLTALHLSLYSISSGATLTFTVSGVGSGSLGGVDFTNQPYVFTTTYDSGNISSFSNGFFVVNDTASITIAGNPTTITDPISLASNNTFGTFSLGNDRVFQDLIILADTSFETYDLQSPYGPLTVNDGFIQRTFDWFTEDGAFILNDDIAASLTMEIRGIPEPSTITLIFGTSILLLKRRNRLS